MNLKFGLITSTALIAILGSFRAFSDPSEMPAAYDVSAFDASWNGQYYVEAEAESAHFDSFEAKKKHYLESPSVGKEEMELNEAGALISGDLSDSEDENRSPQPKPSWSPLPAPYSSPLPSPSSVPFWTMVNPYLLPKPEAPDLEVKPQAFYYYTRGSLKNASDLGTDGCGYVKIFRERDESIGGRSWGTRSLIRFIKGVSAQFNEMYPERERLQIADLSRKKGGRTGHASHQNGLDADIIYVRNDKKEQSAFGGYGKNGFAEQFVVPGAVTYRSYRDTQGRTRKVRSVTMTTSHNFDIPANFQLLLLMQKTGNVKNFFIDQVLIREFFRHAENLKLTEEADVRAMFSKMDHARNHADHVHVRLYCQVSDTKCIN